MRSKLAGALPFAKWIVLSARQSLGFAFLCTLCCGIAWIAGMTTLQPIAVAAFALLIAVNLVLYRMHRLSLLDSMLSLGLLLIGLALSATFLSRIYDTTYDGMRAHQASVVALKHGWNPIKDPRFEAPLLRQNVETERSLQMQALQENIMLGQGGKVNSFYMLTAVLYAMFDNLEASKSVHFLMGLAAFGLTFQLLAKLSLRWAPLWAILFSANPVVLYQFGSFMLDGYTYSLFQICLVAMLSILYWPQQLTGWTDGVLSALLLFTAKISGASYLFALIAAFLLVAGVRYLLKRPLQVKIRWAMVLMILGFLGASIYHLYGLRQVTIHGVSVASISSFMMHRDQSRPGLAGIPELASQWKGERFWHSHASETHINPGTYRSKPPGMVRVGELKQLHRGHGEYRTGGFGPLYSAMLCVALIILVRKPSVLSQFPFQVFAVFVCLTGWMLPIWWARWTPFQWLIPLLPMLWVAVRSPSDSSIFQLPRFITRGGLLACLGLINVCLVSLSYMLGRWELSRAIDQRILSMTEEGSTVELHTEVFPCNQFWFTTLGRSVEVKLREAKEMTDDSTLMTIPGTDSRFRVRAEVLPTQRIEGDVKEGK